MRLRPHRPASAAAILASALLCLALLPGHVAAEPGAAGAPVGEAPTGEAPTDKVPESEVPESETLEDAAGEPIAGDSDIDGQDALASVPLAGGAAKVATTSVRAPNSLTAAGLHVAPRYMSRVGDVDVSALGGLVNLPNLEGNLMGGQISLQARILPNLVALADMGPVAAVGLRGPLWADHGAVVGWDAHYRSDVYFAAEPGFGLSQAGFGIIPGFPGGSSQGLELSLNSEYAWNDLRAYATPLVAVMSNRRSVGLIGGADYDIGPFTLGYGATLQANVSNPGEGIVAIQPLELKHSLGLRAFLGDWAYLQFNYHLLPSDTYNVASQAFLAGVGTRLLGSFDRSPPLVAKAPPTPAAAPVPVPASTPAPEPSPTPMSDPAPTPAPDYDSLVGRIYQSGKPGGNPGVPLEVALKVKTPRGWANAPQSARTDAKGRYVFHRLPDGEYQVVYRNRRGLRAVAGAVVSDPVAVKAWTTPRVDLDIAWKESAIEGRIKGNTIEVEWPDKASAAPDSVYEVIVKFSPDKPFVAGSAPASSLRTRFEVSDAIKGQKLYYTVKYWKKGGEFLGSNYYGQSNYRVLEVVK